MPAITVPYAKRYVYRRALPLTIARRTAAWVSIGSVRSAGPRTKRVYRIVPNQKIPRSTWTQWMTPTTSGSMPLRADRADQRTPGRRHQDDDPWRNAPYGEHREGDERERGVDRLEDRCRDHRRIQRGEQHADDGPIHTAKSRPDGRPPRQQAPRTERDGREKERRQEDRHE